MSKEYMCKLLIVGDAGVGKTSFLCRFTDEYFYKDYSPTIGVDFRVKYKESGSRKVKLYLWDTAGQEKFRSINTSYYRGANGIIICTEATDTRKESSVNDWLKDIQRVIGEEMPPVIVVATKSDRLKEPPISPDLIETKYGQFPLHYCSAYLDQGISDAIDAVIDEYLNKYIQEHPEENLVFDYDGGFKLSDCRKKIPGKCCGGSPK